jgi:ssDNA-binding Zn-finger/Zn-ribbon topoisomerase 1
MKDLLLPYAYDSTGKLVYIENAQKNETYTCPECGCVLMYVTSKIPEGQKYHRRNHFSHPNGGSQCSESFLHKLFKERAAEFLRQKIANQQSEFQFHWDCEWCGHIHHGNMLKKAVDVRTEYNLGTCQPDIAILNKDGNVTMVIEIVVTHKPTTGTLQYYKEHKIGCLQIEVTDFEDCKRIEAKLSHPDSFVLWEPLYCKYVKNTSTSNPKCEICGKEKSKAIMIFGYDFCYRCNEMMRMAIIKNEYTCKLYAPEHFTEKEIEFAKTIGANIKLYTSKKRKETFNANICDHCGMFGKKFLGSSYTLANSKEYDLGYKCFHCIEDEEERKREEKREVNVIGIKSPKTNHIAEGKICPKCQCELVVKQSSFGTFYACGNYPNCKYTESINKIK